MEPSDLTTASLGLLSRLPSYLSASTTALPVLIFSRSTRRPLPYDVIGDSAEQQTGRVDPARVDPHRAFHEAKAAAELFDLGVLPNDLVQLRRGLAHVAFALRRSQRHSHQK